MRALPFEGPAYSHRDHRAFRGAYRFVGLVTGAVIGLVLVVLVSPIPQAPALALIALAVVGFASIAYSERLVAGYEGDLQAARSGGSVRGDLIAEVARGRPIGSDERRTRSPHSRTPRVTAPPPPSLDPTDRLPST